MICTLFTSFFSFAWLCSYVLAIPPRQDYQPGLKPRQLKSTSRYARLTKLNSSTHQPSSSLSSHNTIVRPTNQLSQHVIEVHFNNIPRYLLLDTGSADTWMISPDFQCLNSSYAAVPQSDCAFVDPYTGPEIHQTRNETYDQVYGNGEVLFGTFGQAEVTIADLTVQNQKVVLVNRGYGLGDHVRSGVIGLAPRAVTRLFENTNASTSQPNGTVTTYSPIFESMYSHTTYGQDPIAPLFSLALERGEGGGYIAFGGLPPINFTHDFTFTPFKGINYYGSYYPGRYYPIQPQGFSLNGQAEATDYRAIVDSGTAANRLPQDIADRVNAAFNPPATYYPSLDLYVTVCNATVPSFSFSIGDEVFAMSPADMFLPFSSNGLCATSFTRGFEFGSDAYPEGFYVLGDAFLNSVVAVFDVGAGGMWFATHDY